MKTAPKVIVNERQAQCAHDHSRGSSRMKQVGKDRRPAYRRIQTEICERIGSGRLKPGDLVESERELARLYNVSLMTARHALSELAKAGLVSRRQGRGTFVASGTLAAEHNLLRTNRGMVYLGACLIAGLRLAHQRQADVRVVPTNRSIEESLELAHEIYDRFSGKVSETADQLRQNSIRSRITPVVPR
jgi:DNA-binding GntR family transcriptional regulator